jgi:prolyl 4-hydroxylase
MNPQNYPECSSTNFRLINHPLVKKCGNGEAEIFVAPEFLTAKACESLVSAIDANRIPSTVADYNGDRHFRTSETCNLDPLLPVVEIVRSSIAQLLGIDPVFAEPLQGQRYAPGQEFKLHCDWFRPTGEDYVRYCSIAGQRTWTAMAYLNDVDQGGQTQFPHLDLSVTPESGTLILWNNLRADGSGNPMTAHHARPVVRGVKHVITLWFRERPYVA